MLVLAEADENGIGGDGGSENRCVRQRAWEEVEARRRGEK